MNQKSYIQNIPIFLKAFIITFLFLPFVSHAAFPDDWMRVASTTIDSTKVDGDLTNFPVLLTEDNLPSEMFDKDGSYAALDGGGDIRFTLDLEGNNKLAAEIVSFVIDNDPSNGSAQIWVKIPSLSSTVNTTLYIWYKASGKSQPDRDDSVDADGFSGSDNVWTDYHGVAHLEGTSDSKSINRTLVNTNSPINGEEKIGNGYSYNGSNQYTDTDLYSWEVPAFNGSTWANTGLTYDSDDDALWIGDWENDRLVKTELTGEYITSIDISAAPQGVAYDTSDQTLWWSDHNGDTIRHVSKEGTVLGGNISLDFSPNGLAYEEATDSIWVVENVTNNVHRYSANDGTLQETLTISGAGSIDGIEYDESEDVLYLNVDTGQLLYKVSANDGSVEWSISSTGAPEDLALVDNVLYMNSDAEFHSSTVDGNRVYKRNINRYTDNFSVALWFDLDSASTSFLLGQGAPLGASSRGWGFYMSATNLRLFLRDSGTQIMQDRTIGTGFRRVWMTVDRDNGLVRLYDNGSLLGSVIDISAVTGVIEDGRPPRIAASMTPDRYVDTHVDEVVFYNNIASPEFISTEYNNQNSPSTFAIAGAAAPTDSTAPTILSVTSDKINGTYGVGETIDIDVIFSEEVTSVGNISVTLETGITDRICTFSVSTESIGSCNYTIQEGDESSDLNVNNISGTIIDGSNNSMTNFTPITNLSVNKDLIINTEEESPTITSSGTTYGSRARPLVSNLPPQNIIMTPSSKTAPYFNRSLTLSIVGDDVRELQRFLNSKGYILAASGPGSPGNETNFFGNLTRLALVRFQKENGIFPSVGFFGPITKKFVNSILASSTTSFVR